MNILLFVMSMLMLLTLMTYGRIESYRGFAFMQVQFKEYMQKTERNYANAQAVESYEAEKGSTRDKKTPPSGKNKASSKLSFNLFIDVKERMSHLQELETQRLLAKNLIYFLYSNQAFFQRLEQKRPGFVDEILDALIRVTEALPKEKKLNPKKVGELATVDLGDPELNEIFTSMMRGSVEQQQSSEEAQKTFLPAHGYDSLLNFVTLERNKLTLRIFLAAPQLLMAIYGNARLVEDIIRKRSELRNALANELIERSAADQEFSSQFAHQQLPNIPDNVLDFGTSTTRASK